MRGLGTLLKKKKRTKDSRNSRNRDLPASPGAESASSRDSTNPLSPPPAAQPTPPPNPLIQHPASLNLDTSRVYPVSATGSNIPGATTVATTLSPTIVSAIPPPVAAAPPSSSTPEPSTNPPTIRATSTNNKTSQPSAPMNPLPSSTSLPSNIAGDPSQLKQQQQQQQQQQHQQQQQPHHYQNVASIKNIINPPHHDEVEASQSGGGDGQHVSQQQPQQPQLPQHLHHHQHQQSAQSVSRQTKGKYSLDDFTLQRTLGTGSFGRVHLVQSRHNQRFYAIKVLKKAQVVKMKQVEHTNDERRMLQRVKHPFLITLWGTFQDSKNLYMVMDFVEGGELFSLLRKSQRFPNPVAKFYAAEVTLALEYLHEHHIVYRDLKPENLLLDRHGHLKITDFGFAKEVRDITWTLCGTPDYLAPEVVSSKGYNMSVDWWSLGILIFEMLCGFTPFWDSGSPMKIYENIVKCRVKYPPYMHPDAQDLLSQLITPDLTVRLGNLHGGSQDVKNHPWFAEVTWDRLARKDIDAPYIPPVKGGQGDASQFDRYPEETEAYGGVADDP
ncbi:AGC/PKA protein kinase [Emergomyces pasteurianus Ep9510]|uniref:cAMP-dependent protein kinase n=1 Tax=Emergomyces pasteurianus Ep9510 TaxID=1447872 RepID=A0A1J9P139_9EURO|nr:AGC/PKA protein kinase [Emergomyces pasteurianus Ep9510]